MHCVDQVYGEVVKACLDNRAMVGSFMWMTAAISYPDYDGTTVYLKQRAGHVDADVVCMIRNHAAAMNSLNTQGTCDAVK